VSRILVRDLVDFLEIVTGAKRVDRQLRDLGLFRGIALVFMLLGLYWWMLR
jgi:hypothetical protein